MGKDYNSYEEMSENCKVFEESEVPFNDSPMQNKFEESLASGKGFDQSGMNKQKG